MADDARVQKVAEIIRDGFGKTKSVNTIARAIAALPTPHSAPSDARVEPTEFQVTKARVAILSLVPVGYGMTREEADNYARAAIKAAMSEGNPLIPHSAQSERDAALEEAAKIAERSQLTHTK